MNAFKERQRAIRRLKTLGSKIFEQGTWIVRIGDDAQLVRKTYSVRNSQCFAVQINQRDSRLRYIADVDRKIVNSIIDNARKVYDMTARTTGGTRGSRSKRMSSR
jgi:hypothetical protein